MPGEAEQLRREVRASFEAETFALEAVKRAAHRFTGRASAEVRHEGEEIICILTFEKPLQAHDAEQILQALRNEVLDQDLRRTIFAETESIRNAILAYTFSRTGLQGD